VFVALYQLIGAISYSAISDSALTGMYGRRRTASIEKAFASELESLVASRVAKEV
jgi:hypothetical protein